MKKHILSNYKTNIVSILAKRETSQVTFIVETSDTTDFSNKRESTRITESVEASDRNEF